MTNDLFLRVSDSLLALLWLWVLIHTLRGGFIGPRRNAVPDRRARPALYWFMVFIFALMVLHFGGLAWVGQKF